MWASLGWFQTRARRIRCAKEWRRPARVSRPPNPRVLLEPVQPASIARLSKWRALCWLAPSLPRTQGRGTYVLPDQRTLFQAAKQGERADRFLCRLSLFFLIPDARRVFLMNFNAVLTPSALLHCRCLSIWFQARIHAITVWVWR